MELYKIIAVVLAILSAGISLFVAFKTNMLRASNSPSAPYSFSRFQLWLWTLVILPVFILHWGFHSDAGVLVNEDMLILLGISLGTSLGAQVVDAAVNTNRGNAIQSPQAPIQTKSTGLPTIQFITDLLMDDHGQFSIVRLQQLMFTVVYVVIYISLFFHNEMQVLPDIDNSAYTLMGISAGGYVLGKSTGK